MSEEGPTDPVTRARSGDLDAFEELVHGHAPAVYRLALAVVGESLARDLVAEAFLAAWRQLPRLRDPGRFSPWLQGIVVNRGRSMLRRGGSVREIPVSAWHERTPDRPQAGAGSAGTRAVLASTFAALSYDQRAVIALHYSARCSLNEVAAALDARVGTTTGQLATALEALRRRAGIDGRDGVTDPTGRPAPDPTGDPLGDDRMPPQDPRVEAFLASLADVRVPVDLATSVMTRVRARPSRRPSLRLPLLAGAAGLLIVLSVAMAAGWDPPFDLVPGPGPTASAVAPSPRSSTAPVEAFEFARIAAGGAELRTQPGAGDVIVTLTEDYIGTSVLVLDRREVDGRRWTRIEWDAPPNGRAVFAWLPETVDSIAPSGYQVTVLQPDTFRPCFDTSDVSPEGLASLTGAQRLACFGTTSIDVGPVRVVADPDLPHDGGSPAWLADPVSRVLDGIDDTGHSFPVVPVRINPDLGLTLPVGAWIRVTGHFDDPAAASCQGSFAWIPSLAGSPAEQVLWCRQQFVVTGMAPAADPHAGPTLTPEGLSTILGWRQSLPMAPIAGRLGHSAVWTGTELVVWGGDVVGDVAGNVAPPDGAAFDVSGTHEWRLMAPSPLTPRRDALIAWTGSEVLIWGGHAVPGDGDLVDGAAWNPVRDTWRRLPAASLDPDFRQEAAWTGDRWLVMSGPTLAAYEPVTNTWRGQAAPPIGPDDAPALAWGDDRLVLMTSTWDGVELWTLPTGGAWRNEAPPPAGWAPTNGLAVADGVVYALGSRVPRDPDAAEWIRSLAAWRPGEGTWTLTDVPIDSASGIGPLAWTGTCVVVFGADGSVAWDPATATWSLLPGAGEDRLREDPSVTWTDIRLLVWGGGFGDHGEPQPDGSEIIFGIRG